MKHETNLLSVSDKSTYKLHFINNKDTSSCAAEFAWKHYDTSGRYVMCAKKLQKTC